MSLRSPQKDKSLFSEERQHRNDWLKAWFDS